MPRVIGTRWGLSDVQAYWLSLGGWYCIILPTLYDPDTWPIGVKVGPFNLDDSGENTVTRAWEAAHCTIAPDWRMKGEALEPSVEEFNAVTFFRTQDIRTPERRTEENTAQSACGMGISAAFALVWCLASSLATALPSSLYFRSREK